MCYSPRQYLEVIGTLISTEVRAGSQCFCYSAIPKIGKIKFAETGTLGRPGTNNQAFSSYSQMANVECTAPIPT